MKKDRIHIPTYLFLSIGLVLIALPMYLTILNSFKETRQITGGFFEWPDPFTFNNFQRLWEDGVVQYFANSMLITTSAIALIILIVPMAPYSLARTMDPEPCLPRHLYLFDHRDFRSVSSHHDSDHFDDVRTRLI
ncbi:hypothetical protein OVA29_12495 [Exiguobacterium sp. SL14]|nr:hypothetical protein [Exiguobacterium sp. SL14]MCY1691406.1 hypothetical protein [Exiguobacterium sp. SL14]